MTPRVTIIIPLYNKAVYIVDTIASVQDQTFTDWELIVVDNLSTDDGPDRVRQISDPRIKQLTCSRKGVSAARNTGMDAAQGQWLVFLDADDFIKENYLASQLDVGTNHPEAALVVCCYEEFTDGKAGSAIVKRPIQGDFSVTKLRDSSIVYCPGPQHIFMLKKASLVETSRWSETLDKLLGEDTNFWFKAITQSEVAFNPAPLAKYRIWAPDSRFTNLSDPRRIFRGISAAVKSNIAFLEERGQEVSTKQADTLMRFFNGVYRDARKQGQPDVALDAASEVSRWLAYYLNRTANPPVGMRLRHHLGLRLFTTLFGR